MRKEQGCLIAVGVDVSKETLAVCEKFEGEKKFYELKNDSESVEKLSKGLKKIGYKGMIVMESTGRYHLLLALGLKDEGLDVRVINPLISKKHASSSVRKVKSDKKDSEMLAQVAICEEKLPETFSLGTNEILLKKKMSLVAMMDKELQKMKAAIGELDSISKEIGFELSSPEKKIMETVSLLEKQKKGLERELEKIMKEEQSEEVRRYVTIPGVSLYGASVISLFFSPMYALSPKEWIAFAGLDISIRESGHWKGRGKLTKRGNGYLRKKLYQAAWGATMHSKDFKEYYYKLKAKGKGHKESLIIIARKLVIIMFNLAKKNEDYDPSKIVLAIA